MGTWLIESVRKNSIGCNWRIRAKYVPQVGVDRVSEASIDVYADALSEAIRQVHESIAEFSDTFDGGAS